MAERSVGSPLSMHDPRFVGPWTIHSRLGAGGMGVVFFATHAGAEAALKVIRPGLLDAPATRDRFRREVGILRSVRDLHICQYLDADLEHEPAWLALEYLSGPTLRDEVTANGPLSESDWWELARGLAQALSVLEIHRITHRDLKPGNVILNERGPVLIDFGIAHPEDATQLTATGLVTGSPAWLSPEQANLDPTGPATDVFTLGSLLAFAGTGRPPFGEGASVAVLMSIIKRDPDLEGLDPVRASLLHRLLAKDPAERPSAREILDLARLAQAGTLLDLPARTLLDAAPASSPSVGGTPVGQVTTPGAPPPAASSESAITSETTVPDVGPARPSVSDAAGAAGAAMPSPSAAAPAAAALPPPPARPAGASGARTAAPNRPGPRTTAAQQRRSSRRRWVVLAVLAIATALLVGWLQLGDGDGNAGNDGSSGSGDGSSASTQPDSAKDAPPAPDANELGSGQWFLDRYSFDNTADGMAVDGTVRNKGDAPASAELTVWVYLNGESLGSASTTVTDVPAGGTTSVRMTGDAIWKPGEKVVLFEAK